MKLTAQTRQHLIDHGFAIVPRWMSSADLARARAGVAQYFPSVRELEATPERYGFIYDDPEHLQVEFPFSDATLNYVAAHPGLIEFVQNLLGTDRVRLSQSAVWVKYAGLGHHEQGLHLDYQGNTLVVPRDDAAYRQVNMILYYTDVTVDLGPTFVVPQEKTRDLPLWPTHRWRKTSADLYAAEQPVLVPAGSLLIFSMRTWHRASAMTAEQGARFTQHFVWRAADHDFQGYHLYARHGEDENLQNFLTETSPLQREVLGFPPAGDAYWTEETLAAVALRYPSMNLRPYRRGVGRTSRPRR